VRDGGGPSRHGIKRRRRLIATGVIAVAIAAAWPIQQTGWTQKAHYALVRSLADGTPRIDRYQRETGDKSYWRGHFFSAKAPGLALVSVPPYLALEAVGLVPSNERNAIWLLNLLTVVPFALLLLVAARWLSSSVTGDSRWTSPMVLVTGTLVLPFSTLFFSHVPTTALAALAAALALRARGATTLRPALLAGLVVGLAVVFEYPTAVVLAALGAFLALTAKRRLATSTAYGAGAAIGLAPLAAYNAWAFGSAAHLSYAHIVNPGDWQADVPRTIQGTSSFGAPSLHTLAQLLLSDRGLVTLTPIVVAGAYGLVLLARAHHRAEAILFGGICVAAITWNSGFTIAYGGPFGGDSPGPRYLIAVLPFLLCGLAYALRRAPVAVTTLAALSVGTMAVATATKPLVGAGETHAWTTDLANGTFTTTPFSLLGLGSGWISILPFFAALLAAAWIAFAVDGIPLRGLSPTLALGTAFMWALVAWLAPKILNAEGGATGTALALGLLTGATAALVAFMRLAERGQPA
jgi:hypothetical protein